MKVQVHFGQSGNPQRQGMLTFDTYSQAAEVACEVAVALGKYVVDKKYFLLDKATCRIQWDTPEGNFVEVSVLKFA